MEHILRQPQVQDDEWTAFFAVAAVDPGTTISGMASIGLKGAVVDTWSGDGHPSWIGPVLSEIGAICWMPGNYWVVPCCASTESRVVDSVLPVLRDVQRSFPAWRVLTPNTFFLILSLVPKVSDSFLRELASFASGSSRAHFLEQLKRWRDFRENPSAGYPDTMAWECSTVLPVVSGRMAKLILSGKVRKQYRDYAQRTPWFTSDAEELAAALPFHTDSPAYEYACAAVRHATVYETLRKQVPATPLDIPTIRVLRW